ncbi:MAG: GWxTD domain-containing protein [Bacteroidota bacterium]|nr:GWxTD domain-containing protein [Bacteroidota bacterium]
MPPTHYGHRHFENWSYILQVRCSISFGICTVLCAIFCVAARAQAPSEFRQIFDNQDVLRYEEGASMYLDLLQQASEPPLSEELQQHLQLLKLITPATGPVGSSLNALQKEDGGPADVTTLIRWWNQQDPMPTTFANERIIEHLSRTYYALHHYGHARSEFGVDDRGEILIRLGWPDTQTEVKLKNAGLYLRPIEYTLPRNEFWVYRRIHQDAHYFFIYQSKRHGYKMGTVEDLIPNRFRTRQEDAPVLLRWLDEIYQQLSIEHEHYGPLFDTVTNYVSTGYSDGTRPFYFTKQILRDARILDDFQQNSRNENVPVSDTEVARSPVPLIPEVRWARFLEPEGTTRLDISWAVDPKSLRPGRRVTRHFRRSGAQPTEDFLLTAYLIMRDDFFLPSNLRLRQYHLKEGVNSPFAPRTWVTRGLSGSTNVALQWEYSWTHLDSLNNLLPSAKLGFSVQTLDSIHALNGEGRILEMSDILLTELDEESLPNRSAPVTAPYWDSENPLGIYFEIYFLRFNDQEQTSYTVAYEIQNIDGTREPTISTSTPYNSASTTVKEHIVLDLSAWQQPHQVAITVKVTDDTSGATVERSTLLQLNTR